MFQGAIKGNTTPPQASFLRPMCTQACVALQLSPVINLGPITTGPIELGFPGDQALSLNIGGPGNGATVDASVVLGPIVASLSNGTIEEFPTHIVKAGVDVPIDGSTGSLDLRQTDLSLPVQALLYQRVGYCAALGITCGGELTVNAFNTYVNGGSPAGSAPAVPVGHSGDELGPIDDNLGGPIGPMTLFPSMTISQAIKNDTTLSGSGTLRPFPVVRGSWMNRCPSPGHHPPPTGLAAQPGAQPPKCLVDVSGRPGERQPDERVAPHRVEVHPGAIASPVSANSAPQNRSESPVKSETSA